ncbi:MAG TPA: 4Fe-4S binding protein [Clostridiales bacterium]|jgi:MinD superfamily P-loop ATPase|nr:4Fe-4S binding protein [Clostridiales bacterium]
MRKLLILSGKGGTGKTTVAAAFIDFLSVGAFADCDVDAPNLHIVTEFTDKPEQKDYYGSQKAQINQEKCVGCGICEDACRFNAIKLINGKAQVDEYACEGCSVCQFVCPHDSVMMVDDVAGKQILYRDERVFSTAKLKMGRGNSGKLVTEVKNTLFKSSDAEFAILDGSPGIGCPVIASVTGVDLVLIVAEPSVSGMHDMERILKTADILGVKTAVCVNKYDVSPQTTEKINQYCLDNNIPFVGKVPYDIQASKAINAGHSLASVDCPAREALKTICTNTLKLMEEKQS